LDIQSSPTLSHNEDGPTILVSEDDVLVRLAVADELRRAGFQVIEAGNADEALTAPMDGIALATTVEVEFPDIVLAIGSGERSVELPASVKLSVRKPYVFSELIAALAHLIQKGTIRRHNGLSRHERNGSTR
jgi:hypothetical protein